MTFKSGHTRNQIDHFLMRANSRKLCRDYKVIPSECLTMQHRLLVMDVEIRGAERRKRTMRTYNVRWWNLNGENATKSRRSKLKVVGTRRGWKQDVGGDGGLYSTAG